MSFISVCCSRCEHELSKSSYNARVDLADILDANDNFGIQKLMRHLLSGEDYKKVWRSCHGGEEPALGLMFHLASRNNTTIQELWAISSSCGFKDVSEFIAGTCRHSPSIANQRLDEQSFDVLLKIAEMLSESPNTKVGRAPWKRIACSMGLSTTEIANLDLPASLGRDSESLTMAFISFMTAKFPFTKIAKIAQGLVDINREDVLKEDMFEKCRKEGCILL